MAKSKRAKVVNLTKTAKKGKEDKGRLIDLVREKAAEHEHFYIFKVSNMRNVAFKQLREAFGSKGRFFFGKNKVLSLALGKDSASEVVSGASKLAPYLVGDVGLLITDLDREACEHIFQSIETVDFARTGSVSEMTVIICADEKGLRNVETGEPIAATCEPQLRASGMPTLLRGGAVLLAGSDEYTICKEGNVLNADQTRLLKLMGIKMASFAITLKAHLFDGKIEAYAQ